MFTICIFFVRLPWKQLRCCHTTKLLQQLCHKCNLQRFSNCLTKLYEMENPQFNFYESWRYCCLRTILSESYGEEIPCLHYIFYLYFQCTFLASSICPTLSPRALVKFHVWNDDLYIHDISLNTHAIFLTFRML